MRRARPRACARGGVGRHPRQAGRSVPIRSSAWRTGWRSTASRRRRAITPCYALGYPLASVRAARRAAAADRGAVVHSHFPLQALPLALSGRGFVHTFHAPVHRELLPERRDAYLLPGRSGRRGRRRAHRRADHGPARHAPADPERVHGRRGPGARRPARGAWSSCPAAWTRRRSGPARRWPTRGRPGPARCSWPLAGSSRAPGVVELVEACAAIAAQIPDVRVVDGRQAGPWPARWASAIRALGLQEHVRLWDGSPTPSSSGWYRAADLAVLPDAGARGLRSGDRRGAGLRDARRGDAGGRDA